MAPVKKKPGPKPKASKPTKSGRDRAKKAGALTHLQLRFVEEYAVDCNGYKAAVRAGYSPGSAAVTASQLLARDDIAELVRKKLDSVGKKTGIDAERVLNELWNISTADANDLVEYRIGCCRHCYGVDFGYMRTVSEYNRDFRKYQEDVAKNARKPAADQKVMEDFDEAGGIGYDARKPPNPDCEECFGDGEGRVHIKDTRHLSPAARSLYAGVKITKDGAQVLVINKLEALEKLMRHTGQYKVDNSQKQDGLKELLQHIAARNTRLPIKES